MQEAVEFTEGQKVRVDGALATVRGYGSDEFNGRVIYCEMDGEEGFSAWFSVDRIEAVN